MNLPIQQMWLMNEVVTGRTIWSSFLFFLFDDEVTLQNHIKSISKFHPS